MDSSPKRLLTCSEVARRLSPIGGTPINPSTIYRLAKKGRINVVCVGKRVLFTEEAVEEFLERETTKWLERHRADPNAAQPARGSRARRAEAAARRMGIKLEDSQ